MENNNTITENTDIRKTVYDALTKSTADIAKLQEQVEELDRKIQSKVYDEKYVRSDLIPQKERIKSQIRSESNNAIANAENMVAQYKELADRINILDPERITADINLLQPNIVLQPRDIAAMMQRNQGNRTMQMIVLRYAEKNLGMNVTDLYAKYLREGDMALQTAQIVDEKIRYYRKHLGQRGAQKALNSFFGISE